MLRLKQLKKLIGKKEKPPITTTAENANTDNKKSTLITRTQIQNTPFTLVGNKDKGYFLTIGTYRITNYYPTATEAKEQLYKEQWNIIMNLIAIALDSFEQTKQQ